MCFRGGKAPSASSARWGNAQAVTYLSRNEKCQAGTRAPGSCRSETQGKLAWKVSQYSLLEVFSFSFRILSFTGSPDSILTVLVITRLTTSQTGPLYPATVRVGFPPTDLSAGRPITSRVQRAALSDRPVAPGPGYSRPGCFDSESRSGLAGTILAAGQPEGSQRKANNVTRRPRRAESFVAAAGPRRRDRRP